MKKNPVKKNILASAKYNIKTDSRVRLQPKLNGTKELLRKSPFATMVTDEKGRLIYVSPSFKKLFGYGASEIPTINNFFNKVIPLKNNKLKTRQIWETYLKNGANKKFIPKVIQVKNKNSELREVKYRLIRTSGNINYAFFQDVTETRLISQEIFETKEKFEKLFNSANDAIFLMKDNKFIDCNPKTLEIFGCTKEQIINHSPYEFSPPKQPDGSDSEQKAKEKLKLALKNQKQTFEWLHCKYDGTPFFAEVSLNTVDLKSGKFIQAIVRDISVRKEFEQKLKQRIKFEDLITKIFTSFVDLKYDNLLDLINNAFQQLGRFLDIDACFLFSFSKDYSTISCLTQWNKQNNGNLNKKLGNLSVSERKWWFNKIKSLQPLFINSLNQIPKTEKVWINELKRFNIKSLLNIPITQNNKLWGFLGFSTFKKEWKVDPDIVSLLKIFGEMIVNSLKRQEIKEELKVSEERFRSLYENAKVGIYRSTFDGKFVLANPALIKMFGCKSFKELSEQNIARDFYVNPKDRKKLLYLAKTKGEFDGFETLIKPKRGNIIHVRVYGKVVAGNGNKTKYLEGVVENITEKKQAEKWLIESKERAERSDRLKSEFLAQMSHEIRTPINTILSFSSLLKSELYNFISEDLRQSFSLMERAGKRITRTIDLILNMSEIQTGTYEPSLRKFDFVTHVIEPLYLEYRELAKAKNVKLILKKLKGNYEMEADEYTVSQIFNNLLDNAVKYTNNGKVVILLKRLKNKKLIVEVNDTGIGISKEYLPNLFKPFTQEEQGYTRKFEGNGLGLALVKKYCEINNAEIKVHSVKGKGTKFKIIFS